MVWQVLQKERLLLSVLLHSLSHMELTFLSLLLLMHPSLDTTGACTAVASLPVAPTADKD